MGFLDGLTSALSGLADEILSILVYIFNLLVQVFEFIWQVIQIVANYVLSVFKSIGNFFAHLWSNFFKGIFVKLLDGIKNFATWLEARLKPIIHFLTQARQFIDKIYKQYIAPFMKLIQHVRQFLQVLKLLHLKFAADLDKILADVQRDVNGVFLQIRGILNTTIDLLNIIAAPDKLLRRPTLILSVRRSINALIRQTTGLPPGWYFPSPRPSAPRGTGFLPANFDAANPVHNPPASFYLSFDQDNLDFSFLGEGDTIGDGSVDGVQMFDYFDSSAWPESTCASVETCLLQAAQSGLKVA